MKSYNRINNIVGWVVFLFALTVYTLTLEATVSFWDNGEFLPCAYKLQVSHPPGAPLHLILGRIFMLFAKDEHHAAWYMNFMSGLMTAFAVLFAFWSTTHFAFKAIVKKDAEPTTLDTWLVMAAGVIAAACCTFLDSIWFSAVEAIVFATSVFFLMLIFWLMVKWDGEKDKAHSDRWLLLAIYCVGVASGVHLMCILALPAMALIYYFKTYKTDVKGIILALFAGVAILGFFFQGVVRGLVAIISNFELVFKNTLGLPFGTGFVVNLLVVFGILILGLVWTQSQKRDNLKWVLLGLYIFYVAVSEIAEPSITFLVISGAVLGGIIYWVREKGKKELNIVFLSVLMALIGYSTYATVPIRANADTPIDMSKPSDAFMLRSFLNREQYGDRPLVYGPDYNGYPSDINGDGKYFEVTGHKYHKGKDKYEEVGDNIQYLFSSEDEMLFPRMGSWQDDRHVTAYRYMVQPGFKVVERGEKGTYITKKEFPNTGGDWTKPYAAAQKYIQASGNSNLIVKDILSQKENLQFFFSYQVGTMYWRYFMWNFSGRQNDLQGRFDNNDGHWVTGFKFIDDKLLGPQEHLPDYKKANGAHNVYYMIPLILGLLGVYFHFKRDPESAFIIFTLFAFAGVLQIIYMNSPPFEPRERDYTLVGSFAAYCMWIGFGVIFIYKEITERLKVPKAPVLAVVFLLATSAPILMGSQNWDDHDRSRRYTARDFAINYLESLAPNAIMFTQGDNDTYPLWYAQEVEGIRTDVRIINLSLLGVDWYIDEMRLRWNNSMPLKLTLPPDSYLGSKRDVTRFFNNGRVPQDRYFELKDIVKLIASDDRKNQVQLSNGEYTPYLPTKKFKITVDSASVIANKVVPEYRNGQIVKEMDWDLGSKSNLVKNDLITLDLIASNLWERPIYFAVSVSPDAYLGMEKYFQLEGLAYRIVPVANTDQSGATGYLATDLSYNEVMNKFKWGGIEVKDTISYTIKPTEKVEDVAYRYNITLEELKALNKTQEIKPGQTIKIQVPVPLYLDENIQRMTMNLRSNFARLGAALADQGKMDSAKKVLDLCVYALPQKNVPYNVFMLRMPDAYYKVGDREKAALILRKLGEQYEQELVYAGDVQGIDPQANRNLEQSMAVEQELIRVAKQYQDKPVEDELNARFTRMQDIYGKKHVNKPRSSAPSEGEGDE